MPGAEDPRAALCATCKRGPQMLQRQEAEFPLAGKLGDIRRDPIRLVATSSRANTEHRDSKDSNTGSSKEDRNCSTRRNSCNSAGTSCNRAGTRCNFGSKGCNCSSRCCSSSDNCTLSTGS